VKRGAAAARGGCAVALILVVALCVMPGSAQSPRSSQETKSMPGASTIARATAGKEVFRQNCSACHFTETTVQKIGPGLKDLYKRTFSNGRRVTDATLEKWIEAGGKDMPGFKESVKPEQIRALISYIKTL